MNEKLNQFKELGIDLINESINEWNINKEDNILNKEIIEVLSDLLKMSITKNTSEYDCHTIDMIKGELGDLGDTAGTILNGALTLMYLGRYLSMYNFNLVNVIEVLIRELELREADKGKKKKKIVDKTPWTIEDYERHENILTESELRALTEVKTLEQFEDDELDGFFN